MSQQPSINLYHRDCMELMRETPDKHYDLAIVDPPYGIGEHGGKMRHGKKSANKGFKKKMYEKKDWDNCSPSEEYFKELIRISKNQIIWGANHFISKIPFDSACWIVWYKKGADKSDFADAELAWSSFNTSVRVFKFDWIGFGNLNLPEKRNRIHPTQKPVALYKWLLHNYAKPGDKILDTHLGSGSIAIACHEMGFSLDACEIDADYYAAALKRYQTHISQTKIAFA